jgi:hypothetical protein
LVIYPTFSKVQYVYSRIPEMVGTEISSKINRRAVLFKFCINKINSVDICEGIGGRAPKPIIYFCSQ